MLVALLIGAAPAAAQAALTNDELAAILAAERAAREALQAELAAERSARRALEQRVGDLEGAQRRAVEDASIEAQLRSMIVPDDFADAAPRTVFPSSHNPRIGVFVNSALDAGDFDKKLGDEDGDRFSVTEAEVDLRLPIAPWGEGVLITALEDIGGGEFETKIEEAYADIDVTGLTGGAVDAPLAGTQAKVGRFRVPFGHDNKLHTHDLLQVDRPAAVQYLLGEEGLVGDGLEFTVPVSHRTSDSGLGRTSTATVAVVNGEVFSTEEGALGETVHELADMELDSDAPVLFARWSEFWELSQTSDIEVGVSTAHDLGRQAVAGEDGGTIEQAIYGADVTWRHVPDETGVGSWLVQGETIRSNMDVSGFMPGDLPDGNNEAEGWWVTVQRQMSPNVYAGVRVGETDMLLGGDEVEEINPYVSWYLDEFFRVRLQGQHRNVEEAGGSDIDAQRLLLQFTWNFGAHQPHPYWVNR